MNLSWMNDQTVMEQPAGMRHDERVTVAPASPVDSRALERSPTLIAGENIGGHRVVRAFGYRRLNAGDVGVILIPCTAGAVFLLVASGPAAFVALLFTLLMATMVKKTLFECPRIAADSAGVAIGIGRRRWFLKWEDVRMLRLRGEGWLDLFPSTGKVLVLSLARYSQEDRNALLDSLCSHAGLRAAPDRAGWFVHVPEAIDDAA